MPRALTLLAVALAVAALAAASPARAQAPTSDDCLACHQDPGLQRTAPGPGRPASVRVDPQALAASPHAPLDCVACHITATVPHGDRLPRVQCGGCHDDVRTTLAGGVHRPGAAGGRAPTCTGCHGSHAVRPAEALGIDACTACHASEVAVYRQSIHGRSRAQGSEAATCRSCHGTAHAVLPAKDPRASTYHLNLPRTCATCHADPELVKRYRIPVGDVYKLYLDSIHGRALSRSGLLVAANCSDCHGTHDIQPRTEPTSRVHRQNVPATCGRCHAGVLAAYRGSVHGQEAASGNPIAPVCVDCHTTHEIRRVETEAWKLDIVRECGTCHTESLRTDRDTVHGKVTALGFTRVARCSDCHGAHTIRPARDPASRVSPANRVATCRNCHPAANENFARYDPHADPDSRARNPWLYQAARLMRWLLAGTFSFFGVHTVAWGVRSLVGGSHRGSPRPPEEPGGEDDTGA